MVRLFEGVSVRGLDVPSRLWVSPMCQYSAVARVRSVQFSALSTGTFDYVVDPHLREYLRPFFTGLL